MVKPFEDAVFAARRAIRGRCKRLRLSHHQSDRRHAVAVQGFDDVKGQIEADLKRQKAAQTLASDAEKFQNLVYEQAESLEPVAKALNLKVETTPLTGRPQIQAISLGNPKFVQALFFAGVDSDQAQYRGDRGCAQRVDRGSHG